MNYDTRWEDAMKDNGIDPNMSMLTAEDHADREAAEKAREERQKALDERLATLTPTELAARIRPRG